MPLRIGSRGSAVAAVQQRLNENGARLAVDGRYGRNTRAAVEAAQRAHHLRWVDGVVGPETAAALGLTDGFDAPPAARGGRTAPSPPATPGATTPAQPLLSPEAQQLDPMQRLTLMTDRLAARLEAHHARGELVPPNEAAAARQLPATLSEMTLPLMTGEGGRQLNDLSVAAGRLRAAVATLP